jgi:Bacterial Ig-like domain
MKKIKGLMGMSNSWRGMTLIFALIFISVSYVLVAFALTSVASNNAAAQNVTASEQNFQVMDFTLTVGSDSTLGGQTPSAATQTVDDVDTDWTNIYYYDAVGGGTWNVAADMLFVNDGNKYYDDSLDTSVAGITTENTGIGTLTKPDVWNLSFYDASAGGNFSSGADWLGIDSDNDSVYTSAADTLVDANGAPATAGSTSLTAKTALYDIVASDLIVADSLTSPTKVWYDVVNNGNYTGVLSAGTVLDTDGDNSTALEALTNVKVSGANGAYASGEGVYVSTDTTLSSGDTIVKGETLEALTDAKVTTGSTANVKDAGEGVIVSGDTTYDAGDTIIVGTTLQTLTNAMVTTGTTANAKDAGEGVFASTDSTYDATDTIIVGTTIQTLTAGKVSGANGIWAGDATEGVWDDVGSVSNVVDSGDTHITSETLNASDTAGVTTIYLTSLDGVAVGDVLTVETGVTDTDVTVSALNYGTKAVTIGATDFSANFAALLATVTMKTNAANAGNANGDADLASTGSQTITTSSSSGLAVGDALTFTCTAGSATGTITAISGNDLTVNIGASTCSDQTTVSITVSTPAKANGVALTGVITIKIQALTNAKVSGANGVYAAGEGVYVSGDTTLDQSGDTIVKGETLESLTNAKVSGANDVYAAGEGVYVSTDTTLDQGGDTIIVGETLEALTNGKVTASGTGANAYNAGEGVFVSTDTTYGATDTIILGTTIQTLTNGKVTINATGTDNVYNSTNEYVYDDLDANGFVSTGDYRITATAAETAVLGSPSDGDDGINVAATAKWVKENNATYAVGDDIFIENVAGTHTYSAGADTKIAGTNPAAGTALTTTKPASWNGMYFFDAAAGGAWAVGTDSIWTDDGNVYYDDTKDTNLAGITTENTAGTLAAGASPAAWKLDSIDVANGGAWNAAADSIVVDADDNDYYLDRLNAVVVNLTSTSTISAYNISNITLWKDAGAAGYQGAGSDTDLGSASTLTSYIPGIGWNVSGLTTALSAGANRFFVTAALNGQPVSGEKMKMTVDTATDQGSDKTYQQGDNGIFLASALVLDGITNSNFQTVDAGAPSVVLTDDHADSIVRDADTVVITANFTDNGDINETIPPTISIDYTNAGCADISNDATVKSSNLVWTYSWNVPATETCNGTATVSITATDVAGNANTAATGKTSYLIDNTATVVETVSSNSADGYYNESDIIDIYVVFNETVTVVGNPRVQMETGTPDEYATYSSGSGTNTLHFNYTVLAGDTSSDLTYHGTDALEANGGSIKDAAGNGATLTLAAATGFSGAHAIVVDTTAPQVSSVSSDTTDGSYNLSNIIDIKVVFDSVVTVTGSPQVELETGSPDRLAVYSSGSGTTTLHFNYTVQAGDTASDLTHKATDSLSLNGGRIEDAALNSADLTLPNPTVFSGAHAIVIDTTAPTITAVDPATGAYLNFMGVNYTLSEAINWGTITFTRTGGNTDASTHTCTLSGSAKNTGAHPDLVLANGANACSGWTNLVDNVVYTAVFVANDSAGNTATAVTSTNVTYDVTGPLVVLTDDHEDSVVRDANTVVITATFTENYTINESTGFAPKVSINNPGACADISNAAMTKSSNLVWTYSWNVPATDTCNGTASVSITAQDLAGNANSAATGQTSYLIDNTAPVLNTWSLNMNAGTLTMNFNESVYPGSLNPAGVTIQDNGTKYIASFTLATSTSSSVNGTQVVVSLSSYDLNLLKMENSLARSLASSYLTITSAAITDLAGNSITAIADGSGVQATSYTADTTAPTVSSQYPANSTSVISTATEPYVVFSETVNPGTITNATVKLHTYSDDVAVASTVTLVDGNTKAIINPDNALTAGTQYYITVTSSVRDVFGNAVSATWNSTNKADHQFTIVNANYTQVLATKWNTLWIPSQTILESTGRTAANTGDFNFTSVLSSLGSNWNYMYYNTDGTSSGWALATRTDFTGSTLKYVNNTNADPYWINMTSAATFVL